MTKWRFKFLSAALLLAGALHAFADHGDDSGAVGASPSLSPSLALSPTPFPFPSSSPSPSDDSPVPKDPFFGVTHRRWPRDAVDICADAGLECFYKYWPRARKLVETLGLTWHEVAAIHVYTGSAYGQLNRALRRDYSGEDDAELAPLVEALKSGLKKMPDHVGMVKRGATLPADVRSAHEAGGVVEYKAFTSTSVDSSFPGLDQFAINSRHGKYVGHLSAREGENEVLFPPNTRFRVLMQQKIGYEFRYILDEVDP